MMHDNEITAAKAVANVIRTSLGLRGIDQMVKKKYAPSSSLMTAFLSSSK